MSCFFTPVSEQEAASSCWVSPGNSEGESLPKNEVHRESSWLERKKKKQSLMTQLDYRGPARSTLGFSVIYFLSYMLVISHSVVSDFSDPKDCSPPCSSLSMGFSRQEHWSGLPCPPPVFSYIKSEFLNLGTTDFSAGQELSCALQDVQQHPWHLLTRGQWPSSPHSTDNQKCLWSFPKGASPVALVVMNTCQCRRCQRFRFHPWIGKIPWRRTWQPTPVLLPGESHGQRSLAGCSPQGRKEWDTTEVTQHTCMHAFPNVPWGAKPFPGENHWFKPIWIRFLLLITKKIES